MKRLLIAAVLVVTVALLLTGPVLAQEPEPEEPALIELANLFTWARSTPPEWGKGALYAGLGLVGALVTVFGFIGGVVPGTAGHASIEAGLKRVEEREKIIDALMKDPVGNAAEIKAIEQATNNLRDDVNRDRRRQFTIAAILYAVLGAFFAVLLARDLLQALVIGAGWTAFLGALGLKKDYAERKAAKDQVIESAVSRNKELEGKVRKQKAWDDNWGLEDLGDLEAEARVARAL